MPTTTPVTPDPRSLLGSLDRYNFDYPLFDKQVKIPVPAPNPPLLIQPGVPPPAEQQYPYPESFFTSTIEDLVNEQYDNDWYNYVLAWGILQEFGKLAMIPNVWLDFALQDHANHYGSLSWNGKVYLQIPPVVKK
jgi:hypothetical protein